MKKKSSKPKNKPIDPLFQLFEQYLLTRSYEDASSFTKQLAKDYLAYLDSTPAHVPMHVRATVLEDLEFESHELLVRKMYGVVSATDYQKRGHVVAPRPRAGFDLFELPPTSTPDENTKD